MQINLKQSEKSFQSRLKNEIKSWKNLNSNNNAQNQINNYQKFKNIFKNFQKSD